MDKVRLFLKAAVGERDIEMYIKSDLYVEFPVRLLQAILDDYELFKKQEEEKEHLTQTDKSV